VRLPAIFMLGARLTADGITVPSGTVATELMSGTAHHGSENGKSACRAGSGRAVDPDSSDPETGQRDEAGSAPARRYAPGGSTTDSLPNTPLTWT
jgi:hypothetical protein